MMPEKFDLLVVLTQVHLLLVLELNLNGNRYFLLLNLFFLFHSTIHYFLFLGNTIGPSIFWLILGWAVSHTPTRLKD